MDLRPALMLLCFCGLSVSDKILPQGPLDVLVGGTATFRTLIKNPNFTAIIWNFNNGREITSVSTLTTKKQHADNKYTGRTNIDANGALTLSGLTEEDSGEYSINIIDKLGDTQVDEIDLRVMVPASEAKISGVRTGDDDIAVVTCTAKGTFLNFKWFNVSTPITGDGQRITLAQKDNSGTLTFSPINRYDLAKDTSCEAFNSISRARSNNVTLIYNFGPENVAIFPEVPPAFVASQSNFSLRCSSESHPEATYTWFHDGTKLKTTGPVLTVKDIEKEGLGKNKAFYTCKATNTRKTVSSTPVFFTIQESISGLKLTAPVEKLFAGTSSAYLNCSAPKGPMQTVKWLKNGAALSSNGRVVITTFRKSLIIRPLQKEDNGEYTCQISNRVSKQEDKVNLTVYYGPEPVVLTGPSAVEVTNPLKLECSASSMPPATYTWKFNGTKTAVTTNQYVIYKVAFSDTGSYTCEAHNAETKKTSSKDLFLSVKEEGTLHEPLSGGAIAGIVIAVLAAIGLAIGPILYFKLKGPYVHPIDQNTA